MTRQERIKKYVEKFNWLSGYDKEEDHVKADDILCVLLRELGYDKVVDEFNKLEKWYA